MSFEQINQIDKEIEQININYNTKCLLYEETIQELSYYNDKKFELNKIFVNYQANVNSNNFAIDYSTFSNYDNFMVLSLKDEYNEKLNNIIIEIDNNNTIINNIENILNKTSFEISLYSDYIIELNKQKIRLTRWNKTYNNSSELYYDILRNTYLFENQLSTIISISNK